MLAAEPCIERHAGKADNGHHVGGLEAARIRQHAHSFVSKAPPKIAITRIDPAVLVFSPMPFRPKAKMVGNMMDMKRLVVSRHPTPSQPGRVTATKSQHDIHGGVDPKQGAGLEALHKPRGGEAADGESSQGAG